MQEKQILDLKTQHVKLKESLSCLSDCNVMVPISSIAFVPGKVKSRNITISMGENYFIKTTIPNAQSIIDRRIKFLESRLSMYDIKESSKNLVQITGAEQNEEGETFIEIREPADEEEAYVESQVVEQTVEVSQISRNLDDFDIKLLQRMSELEIEEIGGGMKRSVSFNEVVESCTLTENEEPSKLLDQGLQTEELKSDHDRDSNEVFDARQVFNGKIPNTSSNRIFKNEIVVKEISDDEYSSDEDYFQLHQKEIMAEYHRKRQQLISAGILKSDKSDEEILREQATIAEQDSANFESSVFNSSDSTATKQSRFKASRR